ncbi:MAG TPA: hypothetical protein VF040_07090 [Ktedonobacterales bacterium]
MRPAQRPRIAILLLATVSSLLLLLAACGQPATASHARPTPTRFVFTPLPTYPPIPTVKVIPSSGQPVWGNTTSWAHANLPAGFGMLFHESDLRVAASDGKTAYSCAVPGDQTQPGHPRVVVTHDGGATWAYTTAIPVAWYSCVQLVVDMLNPSMVVAAGDFSGGTQEVTLDGGTSWQPLALPPQEAILSLATRGSSSYALIQVPQNGGASATTILAESSDSLRTWHEIDGNLPAVNLRQFWINPGNGALMLLSYQTGLWSSADDGATWQQAKIPVVGVVDYMVQQPIANQPWRLCASYRASENDSSTSLVCTADGGHGWFAPPPVSFWQMAGISSDGALLVYDQSYMVYRLPAGATQWQKLGAAPHAGCCIAYMPSSKGDMLWKFPAESDGAAISDKPNDVYVAAYPY